MGGTWWEKQKQKVSLVQKRISLTSKESVLQSPQSNAEVSAEKKKEMQKRDVGYEERRSQAWTGAWWRSVKT